MALFFGTHTLYKVTCLVCATAPTGKVTFYKVPEKHGHVQLVTLYKKIKAMFNWSPCTIPCSWSCDIYIQPDDIQMAVLFWYLVKSNACVRYCTLFTMDKFTRYQNNTDMYNWSSWKRLWVRYFNGSVFRL